MRGAHRKGNRERGSHAKGQLDHSFAREQKDGRKSKRNLENNDRWHEYDKAN